MLGVVYAERGQYEKAVELERQAVRLARIMSGGTAISPTTLLTCSVPTRRGRSSTRRRREKWMLSTSTKSSMHCLPRSGLRGNSGTATVVFGYARV